MSIRTKATRLAGLVGAAALLGGLALSAAGAGVHAQTPATATPASNVGGPSSVPSARFYGTVTGPVVPVGATVTATIGGVACGFGTVSGSSYIVDVQAISGCQTPGATVNFSVGGATATQTGTLPPVQGTAVQLNLTVGPVATATPSATTAPPPPPPPPPASPRPTTPPTAAPTARPTVAPTAAPTRTVQQPVGQRPAGVAAQKPGAPAGAAAPRPAAPVALPRTGTGGLTEQSGAASVALLGILLGALALSATGLVAYRRAR